MAVNINIPKEPLDSPAHVAMAQRGSIVQGLLAGNHPLTIPAAHQNSLVDNALGLMPHTFSPTDLGTR